MYEHIADLRNLPRRARQEQYTPDERKATPEAGGKKCGGRSEGSQHPHNERSTKLIQRQGSTRKKGDRMQAIGGVGEVWYNSSSRARLSQ